MDRQYVGIDFHRRRSVVVRMSATGEKLSTVRIANDPVALAAAVVAAGPEPEVVIEATYGWYWVVDLLQANGARVHLANPQGLNWGQRRVKNDERDAIDLADMLRLGRLPEAWIAPPATRELRELVRYRAKLVALRSGLKAQVHAVMAKEGVLPAQGRMFGPAGNAQLDAIAMAHSYTTRVASLRDLIEVYDGEVGMLEGQIHRQLRHHRGYRAIHAINGVGPTIAAILVAEIGDVARFRSAEAPCSWAGLTPKHRESDTIVRRGRITKQGSKLVRWAVIEAVSRYHGGPKLAGDFRRIAERRGTNKARVAVARKVLTLVYLGISIDAGSSGESDAYGVEAPSVVRTPVGFLMAYAGSDGAETRLHMASSDDGHRWEAQGTFMQRGEPDGIGATHPCVVVTGERWWLFYSGYDGSDNGRRAAILAAVSPNGASWDRIGSVLDPARDEVAVSEPWILMRQRHFAMFYVSDDGARTTIDMATSDDGAMWERRGTTLGPGLADDDHGRVRSPSAMQLHDGRLRLWYATHTVGEVADSCHLWSADVAGAGY